MHLPGRLLYLPQLRISLNKNMKYSKLLAAFASVMLFTLIAYAQTISTIIGTVQTSDGTPAANVNIGLVGTSIGTHTDEYGTFVIKNAPLGNQKIKISGVGIKHTELNIEVKHGANTLNAFRISESASQLEEVSVLGYKSSNKKSATLGKGGIPARDLPQAVQIITKQIIEDQQADRLGDVMKNVNGVALGANRGGVGENFYARGYSLGANNTFKNGARTTIGGSPEASTLESVEVLKGSAALLYGGVTGGAVVNMITKKPKFENGGSISFRTGSYEQYKGTIDAYGPINNKLAYRVIATGENAGSFRDNVESERFYVNPSLLYKVSEKTTLLFQGDYLMSNYTPDFGVGTVASKIVDFGRDKFLNTLWAYNKTNTATTQANLTHNFSSNWKVNVIASFQSYGRNYFGAERINPPATGIVARNVNRAKIQESTFNQQINLNGEVFTGKVKHNILVGLDGDQSRTISNTFNYRNRSGILVSAFDYGTINIFDPATYQGDGYIPQAIAQKETTAPVFRYGVFIQDLVAISEKFKVLAGLRWTYQKTPATDVKTLATGEVVSGTTAQKVDKAYSPKFGIIYQPLSSTSLYASYANNFTSNSGIDVATNAPMTPSIIDQYEAGIKNDFFGGRFSANLTYYVIKNSNLAQEAASDPTKREFSGATRSDGLEVDVTGALTKGLNVIAGYAYNFMRFTKTLQTTGNVEGVRVVGSTKNTANASLFYTVQSGGFRGLKLGTSAFYTGDRNGGWNDTKNATASRLIPLDGFATFDVSAGYTFSKFSILGKLSNITNELNYFVHENYSVNPIPPRQFVTTLQYKF